MKEDGGRREGFDIDDTLVLRDPFSQVIGAIKTRIGFSVPNLTLNTLPEMDHTPRATTYMSWQERIAFRAHSQREAIPGVPERLRRKADKGIGLYALSGRRATQPWDHITRDQMKREGYPLNGIILTPEGIRGMVSKLHGIQTLGINEFSDDDAITILFLSGILIDVRFNLILHDINNMSTKVEDLLWGKANVRMLSLKDWQNPLYDSWVD